MRTTNLPYIPGNISSDIRTYTDTSANIMGNAFSSGNVTLCSATAGAHSYMANEL